MGMRGGEQVLAGLRDDRELWCEGARVTDVTRDVRFAGGAQTLAELYDIQCDPEIAEKMSYPSPATGEAVGLSFIEPRTQTDLTRRRHMIKRWNDHCLGMYPRSPDFLNATMAAYASGAEAFGEFSGNVRAFYEAARDGDLVMTHSLTDPQVDRSTDVTRQAKDIALQAVGETDRGIKVKGARMLATLAAFADEILVMPAPALSLPETEAAKPYAIGFVVPAATPGLRLMARPPLYHGEGSPLDHPLAARFDDNDCMVVFDNVEVPWERVFIHRDIQTFNSIYPKTGAVNHMGHQFCIKDLSKMEFMMALGFALADATKVDAHQHVRGMLAELITTVEFVKSCVLACEIQATEGPEGTLIPATGPVMSVRLMFPDLYRRACEIIQNTAAGGLYMVPSFADVVGPMAEDVERYDEAVNVDARMRVKLFRLAHDAAVSTFAGRQILYERYFALDPVRSAERLYMQFDKAPQVERIRDLLEGMEARMRDGDEGPAFG
ncbi:MAG: 4-hydroxyphenylacetate 3-hydroxylase N-terminal domain-containing protein [Rhodospirillales bacterium]|jgi:4-hydroxyphenylacetate 3-monooxygenase|nr:4-hydroxyphenylacetate 3-monooxygenase, oxygenase component [Rhodospirillaceae bacterium]MDP6840499.1 4-hydroxyphenylacetate 3-hydroxylase N-terminal domain-containing protein [Rhodospirillales bacterium]